MSLAQTYQYYGYNPYSSTPYQYYPSQNIPSLQPYLYSNAPYSVSNTTSNQPPSLSSSKNQSLNTLFVKNLPFEMSSDEVKKMFGEYGEVAFIKSQIHDRGRAFITFYDMRSAEKAYKKLHGTDLFGRHLVVDFSLKKNNPNNQNISLFVIIEILDYSQAMLLNLDIVKKHMASFGEIYNAYELSQNKYVIQFYDFRKSQNAARYGNTLVINGVRCNIHIPEEDPVQPIQPSQNSQVASIQKAAATAVSLNPYTAYQSAYNGYNYQQAQPGFTSYQQPQQQQQQLIQAAPQVSVTNPQIISSQNHQMFQPQTQQIVQARPQQLMPTQQIVQPQTQQIVQAQPQQILQSRQQQIIPTQPQQIVQAQPQQLFVSQQQQQQQQSQISTLRLPQNNSTVNQENKTSVISAKNSLNDKFNTLMNLESAF